MSAIVFCNSLMFCPLFCKPNRADRCNSHNAHDNGGNKVSRMNARNFKHCADKSESNRTGKFNNHFLPLNLHRTPQRMNANIQ